MGNIRIVRNYMLAASLSLFMVACSDSFFELSPRDRISDATVWTDPSVADLVLNEIYGYLPPYRSAGWWSESWTDNCINVQTWQGQAEVVRSGAMSPSNSLGTAKRYDGVNDWSWDSNFSIIRKCNVFIKNVSESTALTDDYKKNRIAEARFLRAWYYTTVFKYFGATPIIEEPLDINTQGDEIFRPRASAQETADFIARDCQDAADALPLTPSEWGRPAKGAALALKGYILLLAARPLNNPDNDKALWAKAAAAYKQVIDLGVYQLTDYYHGLFLEENELNSEVIFPYPIRYPLAYEDPDIRFLEDLFGPAYALCEPLGWINYSIVESSVTQDLIDAYRMKDGKTIAESPLYDPEHPYENREPRFYESVIYDGAPFRDGYIYTRKGDPHNAVDGSRSTWVTCTGYYIRKTYDERINGLLERPKGIKNLADWPLIRYADVLLGYAEAQNEAAGPDASALDAINRIRQRKDVAIPTVQEAYGTVTREQLHDIILNERRIELAFEDKRYTDITSLKLGHKLQGYVRGCEPQEDLSTGKMTYGYFNVVPQYYDVTNDKNYRLPIPQWIIDRNPNLQQNSGYTQ